MTKPITTITIQGSAEDVRAEMAALLGIGAPLAVPAAIPAAAPAPVAQPEETVEEKPKAARAKPAAKKVEAPVSAPVVSEDVAEQDEADEQAETQVEREERVAKKPERVLTHDDVRSVLGEYVTKFGMEAAQKDGQAVLQALFGDITYSETTKQHAISRIPDTQEALAAAVEGYRDLLAKNPNKRPVVA